jgi:hypothetical protein
MSLMSKLRTGSTGLRASSNSRPRTTVAVRSMSAEDVHREVELAGCAVLGAAGTPVGLQGPLWFRQWRRATAPPVAWPPHARTPPTHPRSQLATTSQPVWRDAGPSPERFKVRVQAAAGCIDGGGGGGVSCQAGPTITGPCTHNAPVIRTLARVLLQVADGWMGQVGAAAVGSVLRLGAGESTWGTASRRATVEARGSTSLEPSPPPPPASPFPQSFDQTTCTPMARPSRRAGVRLQGRPVRDRRWKIRHAEVPGAQGEPGMGEEGGEGAGGGEA